jgi:hypothetical protein
MMIVGSHSISLTLTPGGISRRTSRIAVLGNVGRSVLNAVAVSQLVA